MAPDPKAPLGRVKPFPELPLAKSDVFSVSVDGLPIDVYLTGHRLSFCQFEMVGLVEVTVSMKDGEDISTWDLAPHSAGVPVVARNGSITFRLEKPRKLVVQRVNGGEEILCLLPDSPEDALPVPGTAGVVDVTTIEPWEGAPIDPTGMTFSGAGIQRAINLLKDGGTLYFPPGLYLVGTLRLKSNTSLYLAPGAMLRATGDKSRYTSADGIILLEPAGRNARIYGRGILDGNGRALRNVATESGQTPLVWSGPTSSKLVLDGIVEMSSPIWTNMLYGSNHVFRNVKILGDDEIPNRDGVDLVGSMNFRLDDCLIVTGDDCIANNPVTSALYASVIANSVLYNTASGRNVFMGYAGDATGFLYENLDFLHATPNANINLQAGIGTELSGIEFRNIRVEQTAEGLLTIDANTTDHYGKADGRVKGVSLIDVRQEHPGKRNVVLNAPAEKNPITGIAFRNLVIGGTPILDGSFAQLAMGPYATGITFSPDSEPQVGVAATAPYAARAEGTISAGRFEVVRSKGIDAPLEVTLQVSGTARNGIDYVKIPTRVTIPAGKASVAIEITPLAPLDFATVRVQVASNPSRYSIGPEYFTLVSIVKNIPVVPSRAEATAGAPTPAAKAATGPGVGRPATKGSTSVIDGANVVIVGRGTPVIDGRQEPSWSSAAVIHARELKNGSREDTGLGAGNDFRLLWDDANLYLFVEVRDATLDDTAITSWEKDSVEIFLDEMNRHAGYSPADGTHIRVDIRNNRTGELPEPPGTESVVGFVNGTATGYTLEIRIPFKALAPVVGNVVGFDVQVNEAAGGTRRSIYGWNDVQDRASGTATVLGQAVLADSAPHSGP